MSRVVIENGSIVANPTHQDIRDVFDNWENVTVSVSSLAHVRDGFHSQMSVTGTLEQNPNDESYRVMVNDSTYTYFRLEDIRGISFNQKTGTKVIHIEVKVAAAYWDIRHTEETA